MYDKREFLRLYRRAVENPSAADPPPPTRAQEYDEWAVLLSQTMPFASQRVLALLGSAETIWNELCGKLVPGMPGRSGVRPSSRLPGMHSARWSTSYVTQSTPN
jgi:hypothetical protein